MKIIFLVLKVPKNDSKVSLFMTKDLKYDRF